MAHPRPQIIGIPVTNTISVICDKHQLIQVMNYLRTGGIIEDRYPVAGFRVCILFRGNLDSRELLSRFPNAKIIHED